MDILTGKKSKGKKSSKNKESGDSMGSSDQPSLVKTRKTGVWSEEDAKSSKSKSGHNIIEQERFQKNQNNDGEDDIPIIPDIDDVQEDLTSDIKKIITVDESKNKELDIQSDNLKSDKLTFGNMGDVDLSILINKLYPENEVQEGQEIWTLDSLYKDISKEYSKSGTQLQRDKGET